MAATSQPARSLLEYYGPKSSLDGLKLQMPVTPEELEFFAEQEMVTIIPNFSFDSHEGPSQLYCIGGAYGPFRPNMPVVVPLWLATMLHRRKRCTVQMPDWMQPDRLRGVFEEEKAVPQVFQPLPFYFIEVAQLLFRHNPSETFGSEEQFAEVRHLLEDIRKVRYNKIETGLRKVSGAITVKLNNLAAAECNMIRLLFKGTLDHFYELNKNNKAWEQASLNPSMSMPSL